ncbi:MAG: site-specific DNA-methyltransferase [Leptospiraceae bacterium]|nr:site-specific DNA-methyltransferase [Leptospiraceae bacterium]
MAKKTYKGSLTLEWKNKNKSIILQDEDSNTRDTDVPARLHWINEEESLYYEIDEEKGKGVKAFWVSQNDIRVKEVRPLIFQKSFPAKCSVPYDGMLIKGDNLLALNSLVKMFENKPEEEKVKCIYIDPPYNTGSAFEHYDDNLAHSEWLTMMRDRLVLMRKLLREDGSIFVQIDDKEQAYLKVLLDEVFGRQNFICTFIWEARSGQGNTVGHIAESHEYIIAFARNKSFLNYNKIQKISEEGNYSDEKGTYKREQLRQWGQGDKREDRPSMFFELIAPDGKKVFPKRKDGTEGRWRVGKEKIQELVKNNDIEFVKDENNQWQVYKKIRSGKISYSAYTTLLLGIGTASNATIDLKKIFTEKVFATPKPEALIQHLITISTEEEEIILDCFAGSGATLATAHKLNRKWIGIEIGNHADNIIIPRLKKVVNGDDDSGISKAVDWKGGGNFAYYHLGPSIITINKKGEADFNWKLSKEDLEKNLLLTYDFQIEETKQTKKLQVTIGYKEVNQKIVVGVCMLSMPDDERDFLNYMEFQSILQTAKDKNPAFISVYTNKGIEISENEIPENMEIIKVPSSIFQELEE